MVQHYYFQSLLRCMKSWARCGAKLINNIRSSWVNDLSVCSGTNFGNSTERRLLQLGGRKMGSAVTKMEGTSNARYICGTRLTIHFQECGWNLAGAVWRRKIIPQTAWKNIDSGPRGYWIRAGTKSLDHRRSSLAVGLLSSVSEDQLYQHSLVSREQSKSVAEHQKLHNTIHGMKTGYGTLPQSHKAL
jgi:hypothetical protein